jgi:hypothetical protein
MMLSISLPNELKMPQAFHRLDSTKLSTGTSATGESKCRDSRSSIENPASFCCVYEMEPPLEEERVTVTEFEYTLMLHVKEQEVDSRTILSHPEDDMTLEQPL